MNDFLTSLFDQIIEEIRPPKGDPEYERAVQAYMELEEEVKEKIGVDLLERYQQAESQVFFLKDLTVLRLSLRFGARFALEVLH